MAYFPVILKERDFISSLNWPLILIAYYCGERRDVDFINNIYFFVFHLQMSFSLTKQRDSNIFLTNVMQKFFFIE